MGSHCLMETDGEHRTILALLPLTFWGLIPRILEIIRWSSLTLWVEQIPALCYKYLVRSTICLTLNGQSNELNF